LQAELGYASIEIYIWEIYLEDLFSKCSEDEYSANKNGENLATTETQQLLKS